MSIKVSRKVSPIHHDAAAAEPPMGYEAGVMMDYVFTVREGAAGGSPEIAVTRCGEACRRCQQDKGDPAVATISWDYCFLSSEEQSDEPNPVKLTIFAIKDHHSKAAFCTDVPNKGPFETDFAIVLQ